MAVTFLTNVDKTIIDGQINKLTKTTGQLSEELDNIKENGSGAPGKDGYTPVKGKDYWTDEDKAEIIDDVTDKFPIIAEEPEETIYVLESSDIDATLSVSGKIADAGAVGAALIKKQQLKPEFANSIEECIDQSKLYVLPDGNIYAYMLVVTKTETVPNFTNLMKEPGAYVKEGERYSLSSGGFKKNDTDTAIVVPIINQANAYIIRVNGASTANQYYRASVYFGNTNDAFPGSTDGAYFTYGVDPSVDWSGEMAKVPSAYTKYMVFHVGQGVDAENLIVTLNEEITYTTVEGDAEYRWANTGHAFVPADYEDRIMELEDGLSETEKDIEYLKGKVSGVSMSGNATTAFSVPAYCPTPQLPADGSEGSDFDY
jgi:hypothetical protein